MDCDTCCSFSWSYWMGFGKWNKIMGPPEDAEVIKLLDTNLLGLLDILVR